ncbi:hypothetical protein [Corynebacterium timonense]|uniref:Secreted protein n=1 Tax=Corynebacterium timonense TaxID=441500 RepID=A0A1H1NNE2_9CORY|nr:hypothetical protein [Corynebacterium timonense]SDR99829.1 hypothetical protein SAMN04488539_0807 [Corynebacterium timonense]
MKLRKGFLAAAAAASIATAGVVAPAHADEGTTPPATSTTPTTTPPATTPSKEPGSSDGFGSSADFQNLNSKEKADTITKWLGVATAVISVLGALFGFVAKYMPNVFPKA